MKTAVGKSAFGGIAIGKISVYQKGEHQVKRIRIQDADAEMDRFYHAQAEAKKQLQDLYEKAVNEVGEANAAIFEIHQMMLEDTDYVESVESIIRKQEVNAEYAVAETCDNFAKMFASMDDEYMQARSADVKDISERVISILLGKDSTMAGVSDEPVIILADDLAPSETVQLDKEKVLAFILVNGSVNSHTAILAKTMNIPAIVCTNITLDKELNGKLAAVDGFEGKIFIEPESELLAVMESKLKDLQEKQKLLEELKGKENITLDGQKVLVYANIGNVGDIGSVLKNDAGGIGLFRSEFLYLEKDTYPTEEEQFAVYKMAAEMMAGKRVIIRTLDIGADKQAAYFNMDQEENPALGYRAIRICLTQKDIFKTQLRAIFRAGVYGKIAVMYPMIISLNEIKQIKEIVAEVKEELTSQNIPFDKEMEQGIMIETPAAVMISDCLAKEVDFFSVGTNDLTQYTEAIDRQNPKLDDFYDPHHPAILRMIKMTADNAHKAGIWIGICGELGADLEMTEFFLSIGIDELSVSPSRILPLRKRIRETNVGEIVDKLGWCM
ncbi:phosphoenolpyruvate--protein phosphotransferase [Anaeromicropila populeti]|uniref:Phosphoenolpyruvate-protein phosphotransferase n=1 Tax=Anaeromicropila populeti TaxID=37658 RepID=A0A1I6IS19_9FIRM|nr:phosphoenolpyruvate--protein phosphotransferase [Anaeromicropila populeti]SFR69534.1 phosphoenolpyruvate--protein phosphotransferase [Anaeromicropila populeti]